MLQTVDIGTHFPDGRRCYPNTYPTQWSCADSLSVVIFCPGDPLWQSEVLTQVVGAYRSELCPQPSKKDRAHMYLFHINLELLRIQNKRDQDGQFHRQFRPHCTPAVLQGGDTKGLRYFIRLALTQASRSPVTLQHRRLPIEIIERIYLPFEYYQESTKCLRHHALGSDSLS